MKICSIFLSRKENYLGSAIKIKNATKLHVNIIWIEDFILIKDKYIELENNIIYFLCNSPLITQIINLLENINCYIFNKSYFKNNFTKLQMQKILISSKIKTPKIFNYEHIEEVEFPIFCKEDVHAGIIFKAYTSNTIIKFFEKFNKDKFYLEESINGQEEIKCYFIKENIYTKNNIEIDKVVKKQCENISKQLNLEVFSVDIIKYKGKHFVIDVNPSAGFYLLDEARNKLIYELERVKV